MYCYICANAVINGIICANAVINVFIWQMLDSATSSNTFLNKTKARNEYFEYG